jgi:hypothetical protein
MKVKTPKLCTIDCGFGTSEWAMIVQAIMPAVMINPNLIAIFMDLCL